MTFLVLLSSVVLETTENVIFIIGLIYNRTIIELISSFRKSPNDIL